MQLTPDQKLALENGNPVPVIIDQTECVVLRKDVYERVKSLSYDDSDWSEGELRASAGRSAIDLDMAGPIP